MVRSIILTALIAASAMSLVACQTSDESTAEPQPTATPRASLTILEPGPSTQVDPGQNVSIQYKTYDESGVGRVELYVDNDLVDSDEMPPGADEVEYSGFLFWSAEDPGGHVIEMKAYDRDGVLRSTSSQHIAVSDKAVAVLEPQPAPVVSSSVASSGATTSSGNLPSPSSTLGEALGTTSKPTIKYFRATVSEASPGDAVTLEWDAPGATRGFLYSQGPDGDFDPPREVYPKGTAAVQIDPDADAEATFALSMLNNAGAQAESTLVIPLVEGSSAGSRSVARGSGSFDSWFFDYGPEEPPSGVPVWSYGAQQHFEHGLMIWVEATETIYVLYETEGPPRWESYPDLWEEGMDEFGDHASPPKGAIVPRRGFGLLFNSTPSLQEKLGWPWDEEVGAQTALQSMTTDDGDVAFLQNLYSGVYRLNPDGTWSFLEEPERSEPPATETSPAPPADSAG
jgi:hypothetical protein